MKWIIQDYTLYDPSLTDGEFDTALAAIDHLTPTFDKLWPDQWFIKRNCGVFKLGVFNKDGTDSFAIVAIITQKPKPEPAPLPKELMGTKWEYMPCDKPHCPNVDIVTNVGHNWAELTHSSGNAVHSVSFDWLRKAYVRYMDDPSKEQCLWCGHRH